MVSCIHQPSLLAASREAMLPFFLENEAMLPFLHHRIHVCVMTFWSPSLLLPFAFHLCMWPVRVSVLNLSPIDLVQIGVPAVTYPHACYSHLYQPASRVQQVWWRAPKTCRGFSPLASTTTQSHRCGHGQESEEEAWYILLLWAAWLDLVVVESISFEQCEDGNSKRV